MTVLVSSLNYTKASLFNPLYAIRIKKRILNYNLKTKFEQQVFMFFPRGFRNSGRIESRLTK